MAKEKKPKIVFLIETKLSASRMERKRTQLGFDCLFAVDSVGRGGGLALLWMEEAGFEIKNFSRQHINAMVCPSPTGQQWKMTGFYGQPAVCVRKHGIY